MLPDKSQIKGLQQTQKNMEAIVKNTQGGELLTAMRDATLIVQRDARKNSTVDTGRMRASILPEVRQVERESLVQGIVGSNVSYAPFQELGTKPHWPPIAALETWARRHGMSAFMVARSIATKGTKAVRMLQRAFEDNQSKIVSRINAAVTAVVRRYG